MRAPPGSASNSRLSLQHIFAVLIGTAALLLLLNATYLTSLSPVGDLDVDLDGIVSARDIRRHAAATSPPHTSIAACDPHAAGTIRQRAAPFNPIANASSVIRVGETVRLTVLTARTLRIEQRRNPRERFDERSSFAIVNRYLPVPSHKATLSSDCQLLSAHRCLVLTTAQLRLELSAPANATAAQITRGAAGPALRTGCSTEPSLTLPGTFPKVWSRTGRRLGCPPPRCGCGWLSTAIGARSGIRACRTRISCQAPSARWTRWTARPSSAAIGCRSTSAPAERTTRTAPWA